ncbi:molybdopterin molybdenumtransferase [Bacillus sp. M6-12]|uniref:molybdopterin molybdotransferase MoeA n=1 Tax=Bacillus sp. M6-12 TaxID=2054166 RepID=UPI000C76C282|nr:gephyrin-like molybdotransferase Glp [Bacillus sp. M6-12]PLS14727.1 molybdopterin molybdenumtransferase [Bacillus sp. M6-12]
MLERRKPISISDAVEKVMSKKLPGRTEFVSIEDCDNRYLAEDLTATHDVPHFDRAPYDGFALRSEDSKDASTDNPLTFEVIEELGAGMVPNQQVMPYQAVRIMTGTQMPEECDAVLMLELTSESEVNGKKYITFKRSLKKGENVSFKGEDAKEGDILVSKGTIINPGIKAMLATFGYDSVPVAKKPVIGLFATGSELLEVNEPLQPGKIRNSNSYMISSQILRSGADFIYFGKLKDEFDASFSAIQQALEKVDLLITTGGVSVGDYDLMPDIYAKLGAEVLFNKVGMRPGSVTTVAAHNGKLLFGLSGNPSACYVGFELFVRPIVRTMLYCKNPHLRKEKGILKADFPKANPFTRFVRTQMYFQDGRLCVTPSGVDKSNIIMSLAGSNSLAVLPGGTRGFREGDTVEILMLDDQTGSEWPW